MTFTLGRAPDKFTLDLVDDADFITALRRSDGLDWPDTLVVTIELPTAVPTEWAGELDGSRIRWNVDVTDVAPVIAERPKKVKLWYVDGAVRLLWASGTVRYL